LDDLYQPVLGGAITTIGVWMMALYEFLEAHFHLL
jgi:hypothetical protein